MTKEALGPIEARRWPQQLEGHAISSGAEPRLFGYAVERDLAAHYRFSDLVFLAVVGELPDDARSRAFEVVLCFASPLSIAHAAIHAGALARLCGARPSGVLSAGGVVLGEQASSVVGVINEALNTWEADGDAPLPSELRAADEAERASVCALQDLLRDVLDVRVLAADPSRDCALVAVLRQCGVRQSFQLSMLLAFARLPSVMAEASRVTPGDFGKYPIDTPHFEYVVTDGEPPR